MDRHKSALWHSANYRIGRFTRMKHISEMRLIPSVDDVKEKESFMDRGLLRVAVRAYANIKGMDYEDAHSHLKSVGNKQVA